MVRDGDRTVYLAPEDIDWIEAADYYVEIHVSAASYLHREPLRDLGSWLGEHRFFRIHRWHLVNRERVRQLLLVDDELFVVVDGGLPLRASRRFRAQVLALHAR